MSDLENTNPREEGSPNGKPRLILDRPVDRSLAAFKRWINEMTGALGAANDGSMTEEDWRATWRSTFWVAVIRLELGILGLWAALSGCLL